MAKKRTNAAYKILENTRKNKGYMKYVKEDFIGLTTLGNQMKKYQPTLLASLDAAVKRNYELLSDETKGKVGVDNLIKLSFNEIDDGDFEILFVLPNNDIIGEEYSLSMRITINSNYLKVVINNADINFFDISEISTLLVSYSDLSIQMNYFNEFIDKLNVFISDLVYLYLQHLENSKDKDNNELIYKREMIKNFLDYLTEELNREIFSNLIYEKYVDINVDYDKLIVSLSAYSPDKLSYLMFDYIYSPSVEKFTLTNIISSKAVSISKITNLSVENLLDFIQAMKVDLGVIYENVNVNELVEERKVEESNILFNLKSVNKESGVITLEMNGVVYTYVVVDKEKVIEDVEKEIVDILSDKPEDMMAYIENSLALTIGETIEEQKKDEDDKKKDEDDKKKDEDDKKKDEDDKKDKKEEKKVNAEQIKKEEKPVTAKGDVDTAKVVKADEEKDGDESVVKKASTEDPAKASEKDFAGKATVEELKFRGSEKSDLGVPKEKEDEITIVKIPETKDDNKKENIHDEYDWHDEQDEDTTSPSDIGVFTHDDVGYVEPVYDIEDIEDEEDEIMYLGEDDDEIDDMFNMLGDESDDMLEHTIDHIIDKYNEYNDNVYVTNDYAEDLKVKKEDVIYEKDGMYKLIFNREEKKIVLLRKAKQIKENETFKKALKESKAEDSNGKLLSVGDYVIIDRKYGGGDGFIIEIQGSYVVVDVETSNRKIERGSYHSSDVTYSEHYNEAKQIKEKKDNETFKCPVCGTKVLKNTGYCLKCKKKVKPKKECMSYEDNLKGKIKSFIVTEGYDIGHNDVEFISENLFKSFIESKKPEYFEVVEVKETNKKYNIGIFNKETFLVSEIKNII